MGEKHLQHADVGVYSGVVTCNSGKSIRSTQELIYQTVAVKNRTDKRMLQVEAGKDDGDDGTVTRMKISRWNETLLKRR